MKHPRRSKPLALVLLSLLAVACEAVSSESQELAVDAGPAVQLTGPDSAPDLVSPPADVGVIADTRPPVSSCEEIATGDRASLPDPTLDVLLHDLPGAACVGDLSCEFGGPQNCGSNGFNPYSGAAIGCECFGGHFHCRDYRAEARGCGDLRQRNDGGRSD